MRRWLPVYEAMMHDAASVHDTCLVEIVALPDPADLHTSSSGALWLPELVPPRGAVG